MYIIIILITKCTALLLLNFAKSLRRLKYQLSLISRQGRSLHFFYLTQIWSEKSCKIFYLFLFDVITVYT